MIIFISHSSKNAEYGHALVELLREAGVGAKEIVFTSNPAYGIPISSNIFQWLKSRVNEQPCVIYLLSEEYYESIACLNEMGAAWIIESKGFMLFVPGFNLRSHEFNSGALDPRSIGFFLDDEDRVTEFIEALRADFSILDNPVLINQSIKKYIDKIGKLKSPSLTGNAQSSAPLDTALDTARKFLAKNLSQEIGTDLPEAPENMTKFLVDLKSGKLKDSDVMLLGYVYDQGRIKLMTGWQEEQEVNRIRTWEEVNEYPSALSSDYINALRRLEMRRLTTISQVTSSNNPKEVELIQPLADFIASQFDKIESYVKETVRKLKTDANMIF
jgi:hypothetical protein